MLVTSSAGMSCMEALMFMGSIDSNCPRQCSNDDDDDNNLPKCNPGQPERASSTCGTDKCGDLLASIDDAKLESAIEGFKSCATEPGMESYAAYADMGVDYIKMYLLSLGKDCGHDSKLVLAPPAANTCWGAMTILQGFDNECPRQCKTDEGDEKSLPMCEEGQSERSKSSCGTDICSAFIGSLHDAMLEVLMAGFKDCKSNPATAQYAAYAEGGITRIKMGVIS
eukprot:gnl/MRDRNA2_/MRDRNA2_81561_c0_seq2.p1 gnl/MRDRNA2_/MRDRNA2_81561_c0~~gnl/MRDRNA2_/MRDRNA2_81561_c0_seq2.p1  ORF type:complete len:263 (-),score=37.33 gnl/MRDRNA2_/MRDRNA2_81561_c0_seq2:97-771(-)